VTPCRTLTDQGTDPQPQSAAGLLHARRAAGRDHLSRDAEVRPAALVPAFVTG
jgi:hypothetical protein